MAKIDRKNVNVLKDIVRNPYAWPGGYEKFALTTDGDIICHKCCKSEYRIMLKSTRDRARDGWTVNGVDCAVNLVANSGEFCAHCDRDVTGTD